VTINELVFESEITYTTFSKTAPLFYPVACKYERWHCALF